MKPVYALTGGIACGKSTVGEVLVEAGAIVIDADILAREAVSPGSDGLNEVVAAFGNEVLRADGTLDREKLGQIVFADPERLASLNAILHPRISLLSAQRIAEAQEEPGDPVFYDAALLVENGMYKHFEALIVVACDPDVQRARIVARDGLSLHEADARIGSQMPIAQKVAVADHVLWNNADIPSLRAATLRLLERLRAATC